MNRFIAALVLILVAVGGANAFTVAPSFSSLATTVRSQGAKTEGSSTPFPPVSSSSSLQMVRVKVDPNKKEERFSKADMKMAAYGGSIAIAVALPLVFLVWSALANN